ncbi:MULTISPECIES: aminodeoxychorismate synthase component I [unclassified Sphingobium]|uniref:aminodeoxychorismate synthase component I n=1 Tax=unclassified Sphingobium TaxID=2611147 RepID=UPI0034286C0F
MKTNEHLRSQAPSGWNDAATHPASPRYPMPDLTTPFVVFDDVRADGEAVLYSDPHEIIAAHTLEEILPALMRLRRGVAKGSHAAGYLSYEAGFAFEQRLHRYSLKPFGVPLLWFGLFGAPNPTRISPSKPIRPPSRSEYWQPQIEQHRYMRDVGHILSLIDAGDCYQVNYSFDAHFCYPGDPIELYRELRLAQGAGWGGILSTGQHTLLSCSPELFFSLSGGTIWTKPMKGTASRGTTPKEDATRKRELRENPKECAENLMIVDLLRNDLSRAAVPGTVKVTDLFAIETYPTIHQMTSSIRADIAPNLDTIDLLMRLFPCGSITGAPKIRAMEIIAEQEQRQRGAYSGSMGFITPDGRSAFNVLIRTLQFKVSEQVLHFGVGSGIVRDSVPKAEWNECCWKARFLSGVT